MKPNDIDKNINKPTKGLKSRIQSFSRWKIFLLIVFLACAIILYVSNVLYINGLMKDIQDLSEDYQNIKNHNVMLKSEINQLQSAERITNIATEKLGMIRSEKPPVVVE